MTIHKAQCATWDHALVLVDETMPREAIYTAMSRGRQRNGLYLAVDTGRDDIAHAPRSPETPSTRFPAASSAAPPSRWPSIRC
jgi:ATP-dependent exoDNAse (exonuclease V) alpha subunit